MRNSDVCIACLTRENLDAEWIHFEAGVVALRDRHERLTLVGDTLVMTPAEAVAKRVHLNRKAMPGKKVAVRFGNGLVNAPTEDFAWVEEPAAPTAYHQWRVEQFGENYALQPEAMDEADADSDGIINRLEFLLQGQTPQLVKLDGADAGWFEFSTTRNPAALPAQARIRISEDLIHWQDLPVDGNPNIVVTEDSASRHAVKISPTTSRMFFSVAGN